MKEKPGFPPTTPGILRISHSSLERYLRCGIRYQRQREERRRRTTVALARGGAVDSAAAEDNFRKIESRTASVSELVEIAVSSYEEIFFEADSDCSRLEVAQGMDSTAAATRTYAMNVSPRTAPTLVQEPIVARIGEVEIAGVPDVFVEQGPIDLKVGREWSEADVASSRQLTTYGWLYRARNNRFPDRLGVDTVHKRNGRWVHRRIWSERTRSDYLAFVETVETAVRGIQAGVFLPPPEGVWWCSKSYCPYFQSCPYVGEIRRK